MDALQEKIRKLKCPIVLDFGVEADCIPEGVSRADFCQRLLETLKGEVPGVRFCFDQFALEGNMQLLRELLRSAKELGYYVLLEGPTVLSPWAAERAARSILGEVSEYPCDGLILSPYIGSDAIKPFVPYCRAGKNVFFVVRSANKSATELQDLMTGSRLVHQAVADVVNRYAEPILCRCGYYGIGALTAATSGSSIKNLRSKYSRMFLLVDGYDYPGGNAKTCSYGFDKLGHGCAMSVGPAILGAWRESEGQDFADSARQAVQRINHNLKNYVTIL